MWHYVLCTGCGQVVMASEPCSCVFEVNGVVDSHGVLHTPQRLKLEVLHPTFPPEELALREWRPALTWEEEAALGAQVDHWADRGLLWEEMVEMQPLVRLLPTQQPQPYRSQWGTEYYG